MMLATLMMAAALSQGTPQGEPEQDQSARTPSPTAAAANTFRRRDRDRDLVCTSDAPIGSRVMRNRTCITREEHNARAALARQEASDLTARANTPDHHRTENGTPW